MRIGTIALAAALVAVLAYLALSVTGRGARPALGTSRSVERDGLSVEYHENGAGETVVLLASLARPASDLNELAAALVRGGFRTLAVESRGIGGSQGGGPFAKPTLHDLASDVGAVLDASGVVADERVHVVGHAFGNRVARTFATDHPARVRSLTLIAAGGRARIPPSIARAILGSSLTFLPWSLREPELRLAFFAEGSRVPDSWRLGWFAWGGLAQRHAANATSSGEFWAGGDAPMLVLQAEEDAVARPEDAGIALQDEFPDRVTLVLVAGAGHALLPEQPSRIEASVLAFLEKHRGAAGRQP